MAGPLAHSPADVVRWLMIQRGLGTQPTANGAWPVSAASEPDAPDECITVKDTAGVDQGLTHPDSEKQEQAGVQIRVRSTDPKRGFLKAQAVGINLDSVLYQTVTLDGTTYSVVGVTRKGNVIPLGKETPSSKRSLFTLNAIVALREV